MINKFLDYGFDDIKLDVILPSPVITEHDGIRVVRDDLLAGGTKRRAFNYYVASLPEVNEFVYASPRQGYAQLSLEVQMRFLCLVRLYSQGLAKDFFDNVCYNFHTDRLGDF